MSKLIKCHKCKKFDFEYQMGELTIKKDDGSDEIVIICPRCAKVLNKGIENEEPTASSGDSGEGSTNT